MNLRFQLVFWIYVPSPGTAFSRYHHEQKRHSLSLDTVRIRWRTNYVIKEGINCYLRTFVDGRSFFFKKEISPHFHNTRLKKVWGIILYFLSFLTSASSEYNSKYFLCSIFRKRKIWKKLKIGFSAEFQSLKYTNCYNFSPSGWVKLTWTTI